MRYFNKTNTLNKISITNNINGFSIAESVVAIALLSGVIVLFGYFSTARMSQIQNSHFKVCSQTSQDVMDRIKSVGIVKSVNNLNVTGNVMTRPTGGSEDTLNFIALSEDWLNANAQLWTNVGPALILKNHKALIGSMSLLNSLYNSNGNYCNSPIGIVYSGAAAASLSENRVVGHLRNVSTSIRIQAIDLTNGSLSCPGIPLIIRPAGLNINLTQAQQLLGNQVQPEPGSRADIGFYVTVTTSYVDSQNVAHNCRVSTAFNYPKIPSDDVNDAALISGDIIPDGIPICATSRSVNADIRVSPNLKSGKAITLICRDASIYAGGFPSPPAECVGGGSRQNFAVSGNWVNCNQVTLCGQPPNNPWNAESHPALGASDGYYLNYSNLSLGCNMAIEVKAVDVAHNVTLNSYLLSEPQPPENTLDCETCTAPYINRPPSRGWCPGGGRTMANQCNTPPPPPPPSDGGDGDGDGSSGDGGDAGGHHDGSDGDDGVGPS